MGIVLIALFVLQSSAFSSEAIAPATADHTADDAFSAGSTAFQSGDYVAAAKSFEGILAMGPQGEALDTILFTLASTYLNQKDLTKAEEYYNRSIKEFPSGKNKLKALIALSQIQLQTGHKDQAEKLLKQASAGSGDLADRAKIAQAELLLQAKKFPEAAVPLRLLTSGGVKNEMSVQAAMLLTEVEIKQDHLDEALKLLNQLQAAGNLINNPLQLDLLAIQIGDRFLEKTEREKALHMYALVRSKEVVAKLQKARIEKLEQQIVDNKASLQTHPKAFLEVNATNAELAATVVGLKKALEEFAKQPETLGPVRMRQAKAYEGLDEKWEAILLWESLLEGDHPKLREDALFSIASAYVALSRSDDAVAALSRYTTEFSKGKYEPQVVYLKGIVAMGLGDFSKTETLFGTRIAEGSLPPELAGDMQFLLANSQFAQGGEAEKRAEYVKAIENYKKYLSRYSEGPYAEEVFYRIALASFQMGEYAKALEGFQSYITKYPQGLFVGDAEYRIALCYNAAEKYDEVIRLCDAWEGKHKGEMMYAEVLALKGDAYAAKEMPAESAEAYRSSVKFGDTDELLKYSLFEANKQYQKINHWDDIIDMFTAFVTEHPAHPAVIAAIYWVSKAEIKEGKYDEAKQYLTKNILENIDNRKKDSVEMLISQLAQTCSKRPKRSLLPKETPPNSAASPVSQNASPDGGAASNTATETSVAPASEAPRPSPTPLPPYDAAADFAKYLNESNVGTSALARARLLYGQAELAGCIKKPERKKELMASIYRDFTPDQLSAMLLASCGEIALEKGALDKAEILFKELMGAFPKSDLLEYAYCGMGEVALARNKPEEAIHWFDDAVDKVGAEVKLPQVIYGKGKALLMLGKFDEAKKIFEQVAGTKEWRGAVTAQALLSLGDLEEQRGNTALAIQYYQRVFVAYQRYTDLVVTAYFKAADGFIKLNQPGKAAAHLQEMLSKPRLAASPRAAEARKKLEQLPPPSAPTPAGSATSDSPSPSASAVPSASATP